MIREKILIIEDEVNITNLIEVILENGGYDVISASTGKEALSMVSSHCPDLVILDLGLPDMDGLDVLKNIRSWSQLPVIVVSARYHERYKVAALDLGADDYISKPFGAAELLARIRVAIRHSIAGSGNPLIASQLKFVADGLEIDFDRHRVTVEGKDTHLTQNEFKILSILARNSGKVLTYDFIMKEIWGPQNSGNNQILRVNMANIRRKIETDPAQPKYVFTELGVGYRMIEGD